MLIADVNRAQFRLIGPDCEPLDVAFHHASPEQRRGYWRQLAVYARDAKYRELHKGIGVDGRKLPPRKHPRRDHATGPVLSPHWSDSRFRTELRWQGTPDGAVLWWRARWGRIVGYHARGEVRGAPVRNVIGLTGESQQKVIEQARAWWKGQVATGRMGVGVTMLGSLPMAAGAESLSGWHRVPPARPANSIFAPIAPKVPPVVGPPTIRPADPAYTVIQRLNPWWEAAGRGAARRADIDPILRRLDRLPLPTLQQVVTRFGVVRVAGSKREALDLIRLNLEERLRSGRPRSPKPLKPPGPGPAPLQPSAGPKPKPILETPEPTTSRMPLSQLSTDRGDVAVAVDLGRLIADVGPELQTGMRPGSLPVLAPEINASGTAEAPRIGLTRDGRATILDGRHRLALMLARGVRQIVVAVDPSEADAIRERYGVR